MRGTTLIHFTAISVFIGCVGCAEAIDDGSLGDDMGAMVPFNPAGDRVTDRDFWDGGPGASTPPPGMPPPGMPPPGMPPPGMPPPGSGGMMEACVDVDPADACTVCACSACREAIDLCYQDSLCVDVLTCAQRTGCASVDCLAPETCGPVIDAAGGVFAVPVQNANAVGDCRSQSCAAECG